MSRLELVQRSAVARAEGWEYRGNIHLSGGGAEVEQVTEGARVSSWTWASAGAGLRCSSRTNE